MNLIIHPDFAAALAVERHGRFVAEAAQARRVSQLARGDGNEPLAPRVVAALRRRLVHRTARSTKGEIMDRNSFDELSRTLANGSTRRQFGRLLGALGLTTVVGVGVLGRDEASARKHGKGQKKGNKKVTVCRNGQTLRVAKRALKKQLRQGATRGECQIVPEEQCVPDCTTVFGPKHCGDDGCGGTCGTCPFVLPICNPITFTCEPIVSVP